MRTIHLFAGLGGGLLADLILGHTPVCAVEWDPYCCAELRERTAEGWFPGLHVHEGDIRLFDPSPWAGRVDCIHAGFPCQPFSFAGKQEGTQDIRELFGEVLRCMDAIRPEYVFLENTPGIITSRTHICVCGWPYRRGGVHQNSETKKQTGVYPGGPGFDVGQSPGYFGGYAKGIRGESLQSGFPPGKVVQTDDMAGKWGRGRGLSPEGSSEFDVKTEAGRIGSEPRQDEAATGVDKKDKKDSGGNEAGNALSERKRPCPECGRILRAGGELVWYYGSVLWSLAQRGYDAWWTVLSAADVGAPHLRKRWWCLCADTNRPREPQPEGDEPVERGWPGDLCQEIPDSNIIDADRAGHGAGTICGDRSGQAEVLADSKGEQDRGVFQPGFFPNTRTSGQTMANPPSHGREPRREGDAPEIQTGRESDRSGISVDVCDSDSQRLEERESQPGNNGEEQPPPVGADWWATECDVGRVAPSVPNRVHRLRGLGNAQVPLQAAVAWKTLWEEMTKEDEE